MVEEERGVLGALQVELDEAQRSKGGVCGDGNAVLLGVLDQLLLGEVWVVFDLEGGRADASIAEHVHNDLDVMVADTNAAGELLVNEALHGGPGLLGGGIADFDLVSLLEPAWRVADGGVDIFESDGEMDDEQVEVFHAPVGELLPADLLNVLGLVECLP